MRRIWAWLALVCSAAALHGQTAVTPFYVSRLAPSGAYTPAEFQVMWSAFRKQYRMDGAGTFTQYQFAEMFFASAESGQRNITDLNPVLMLFANTASSGNDAAHILGAQRTTAPRSRYTSANEAMKVVLKWGCPPLILEVRSAGGTEEAPAYKATSVGEGAPATMPFLPSYPWKIQLGQQIMQAEQAKAGGVNVWAQVRELPDEKLCRDHFMTAIKAGAAFKVFVLRDVTCQNCGGVGTISASGGTTEAMRKPVRGSNALDQKCTYCGGDGKVPIGRLHVLVWDKYVPTYGK